jgi:hypothetical protein
MEFVKELLLSNNYWVLNKSVVSEFGVETAFILGVLAEAEKMLADEEGWFYQTSETIEELTGLSNHKQTSCFNVLKEKGILEQKNKGVPMKRYFKINFENIQKLLFKNFKNCNSKNLKSSIQNFSNNKESSYKESNKKNKIKEEDIYVQHFHLILTKAEYDDLLTVYKKRYVDDMIETIKAYSKEYLEKYSNFKAVMHNWIKKVPDSKLPTEKEIFRRYGGDV